MNDKYIDDWDKQLQEILEKKLKGGSKASTKIFYSQPNFSTAYKTTVSKEVIVKNLSSVDSLGIKNCLTYINEKTNDNTLINQDGKFVNVDDVLSDWNKKFSKKENTQEGMHLMFSIDEKKNDKNFEALEKSVKDTLQQNLSEYKYIYRIHDHQGKPHIHVLLNKRNMFNNKLLQLKNNQFKPFFQNLRNDFKDNLNYHNKDFNYISFNKVEKDLKVSMLKESFESMNRKDFLLKILNKNNDKQKENIDKNIEKFINKIEQNEILISQFVNDNNMVESKKYNKLNKQYLTKLNLLNKEKMNIEKFNINKEFINSKLDKDNIFEVEKILKYWDTSSNKKLLSLKNSKILNSLRDEIKKYKFLYENEFKNITSDDESKLKLLSSRTNAFEIKKIIYKCESKKNHYENFLYEDREKIENDIIIQIDKNILFAKSLYRYRTDTIKILESNINNRIKLENLDDKTKNKLLKDLSFYKKEMKVINDSISKDDSLIFTKEDSILLNKTFFEKVDIITTNISAYKLFNLLDEANNRLSSSKNLDDDKKLNTIIKKIDKVFNERHIKIKKKIIYNKLQISSGLLNDQKMNQNNDKLKFFDKELKYINEVFTHREIKNTINDLINENLKELTIKSKVSNINFVFKELKELYKNSLSSAYKDKYLKDMQKLKKLFIEKKKYLIKINIFFEKKYLSNDNEKTKLNFSNQILFNKSEILEINKIFKNNDLNINLKR